MRPILQTISGLALAGAILPPILFIVGRIDLDTTKIWMLAATIVWFAVTPFWMGRPKVEDELVI